MFSKSENGSSTSVTMDIFKSHATGRRAALLPVGAVEAHGHHLSIETDDVIAEALVREVSSRTGILALPAVSYGYLKGLRDFQGSVSLSQDTFRMVLSDIAVALAEKGFSKLGVVNCHIPNSPLIDEVSHLVKSRIRMLNLSFLDVGYVLNNICTSKQWHPGIYHAEEIETSLMLHLRPELVDMSKAKPSYPAKPKDFGIRYMHWSDFTPDGVVGDPTQATKEKGEKIFDYFVSQIIDLMS
jgi:creatinine amidohydrolase